MNALMDYIASRSGGAFLPWKSPTLEDIIYRVPEPKPVKREK